MRKFALLHRKIAAITRGQTTSLTEQHTPTLHPCPRVLLYHRKATWPYPRCSSINSLLAKSRRRVLGPRTTATAPTSVITRQRPQRRTCARPRGPVPGNHHLRFTNLYTTDPSTSPRRNTTTTTWRQPQRPPSSRVPLILLPPPTMLFAVAVVAR